MAHRLVTTAALALCLGGALPVHAADYTLVADVYVDTDTVRRFETSMAAGSSRTFDVIPGYVLKFEVGPEGGGGAATRTSLARVGGSGSHEMGQVEAMGLASKTRHATLSTCGHLAISGPMPKNVKIQTCPQEHVDVGQQHSAGK